MLGVVLVGPASPGFPEKAAVLLAVNVGFAVLTARAVASARTVVMAIGAVTALVTVVGVTWALSAFDAGLFMARATAYGDSSARDIERFPQRPIANGVPGVVEPGQYYAPRASAGRPNCRVKAAHWRSGGREHSAEFEYHFAASKG